MVHPKSTPPLKAESSRADDGVAFVAAVEAGVEALNAGRSVPYEDVRRWLLSWGTDKESSAPKCG